MVDSWISSDGKVYEVGTDETHLEWILYYGLRGNILDPYDYMDVGDFDPELLEEFLENVDEPTLYEIGDSMLQDGWIRVTESLASSEIGVQGMLESLRTNEESIEGVLYDAADLGVKKVKVDVVRRDGSIRHFGMSIGNALAQGFSKALNEDRRVQGIPVSELLRRPEVDVHRYRRRV